MLKKHIKRIIKQGIRATGFQITRIPKKEISVTQSRNMRWLDQFRYMDRMYQRISEIPGNIVECGVGTGRSFFMLSYLLARDKSPNKRMLWGFDSFEGFPEPSKEDQSFRDPQKGEWNMTSEELVRSRLLSGDLSDVFLRERVHMVPGFFKDSLKQFPSSPIALLHIDVDLYASYRDCLKQLFPHVSKGGVVLFDEYKGKKWPGATKAIDDFFAGTTYRMQRDETVKKYYIIK